MTSINTVVVKPTIYKNTIPYESFEEYCLPKSLKEFYKNTEGYVKSDNANDTIIYTRKRFEASLRKYKGPTFIPTLFDNHPQHYRFRMEQERSQLAIKSPMKPPDEPLVLSIFADEVYKNIQCNFRKTPLSSVFLKHDKICKVVYLREKVFAEEAFDELLMRKEPYFYSENFEEIVKSKFVERDMSNWRKLQEDCSSWNQFLVEFCMILPEVRVSTVMVTCVECGQFVETLLSDTTIQLAKQDINHNLTRMVFKEGDEDSVRSVLRLPLRSSYVDDSLCFFQGLMGVTPLTGDPTKPSVFVRNRLSYFCNPKNMLTQVVHNTKEIEDDNTSKLITLKIR